MGDDPASIWLLALAGAGAGITLYFVWDLLRHRDRRNTPRRRGQRRVTDAGPPDEERRKGRDRRLKRRRDNDA